MAEATPVIVPLDTLAEVLDWAAPQSGPRAGTVPRAGPPPAKRAPKYLEGGEWRANGCAWDWLVANPLRAESAERPRTLVCHDMMDGYLQDRFINGTDQDGYYFRHWSSVDIFVYFSHHFITIPPPGWVAAAQLHGVPVLGTIITEWEAGSAIMDQLLSHPDKMDAFVEKCGRIAEYHGFQGWLLNIENPVEEKLVTALLHLVESLTQRMKRTNPEALVLWYDSVTIQGKLEWQDELNELNKPFFDRCDGIFLNYTWKTPDCSNPPKDSLENSLRSLLLESAEGTVTTAAAREKAAGTYGPAGRRRADIYVGVDVFGRGCLGGGGYSCHVAVERVRAKGLSSAIFAPGWTYEIPFREGKLDQFWWREELFWDRLGHLLTYRGPSLAPTQHSPHLIFSTGFSAGRGQSPPWYNLKYLEFQPSLPACPLQDFLPQGGPQEQQPPARDAALYACYTTDTRFYRPSQSLCISGKDPSTVVPLFLLDLSIQGGSVFSLIVMACETDHPETEAAPDCELLLATELGQELRPTFLSSSATARLLEDWQLEKPESKEGWRTVGFLMEDCPPGVEKIGIRPVSCLTINIGLFTIYYKKTLALNLDVC